MGCVSAKEKAPPPQYHTVSNGPFSARNDLNGPDNSSVNDQFVRTGRSYGEIPILSPNGGGGGGQGYNTPSNRGGGGSVRNSDPFSVTRGPQMVNRQPSAPASTRNNNSVRTAADVDGGIKDDDYAYNFVSIDGGSANGDDDHHSSAQYNPNPATSATNSRTNRNGGAAGEPSSCRNSVTSRGGRSGYASPSEGEGDDDALVLICMDCGAEILRKSTTALCKVSGRLHV